MKPASMAAAANAAIRLICLALVATACGGSNHQEPSNSLSPSATLAATRTARPTPVPSAPLITETPPPTEPAVDNTPIPAPEPSTAIGLLTIVDKQHSLPAGYVPPDLVPIDGGVLAYGSGRLLLREEAAAALDGMLAAARAQALEIRVASAYRSYGEQVATFNYWVSVLGETEARRVSAEAGHSEHQLGTTVDLTDGSVGYDLAEAFGETASGRWLREKAHLYGFALSYPAGAEAITGYAYEPWHFRYIGPEHAASWRESGLTLVEYLRGLES